MILRFGCLGLALHTFHGHFFVRSTDLLAMANINPDIALGAQVEMEESLTGLQSVCFQAALLYTSSKGYLSTELLSFVIYCTIYFYLPYIL